MSRDTDLAVIARHTPNYSGAVCPERERARARAREREFVLEYISLVDCRSWSCFAGRLRASERERVCYCKYTPFLLQELELLCREAAMYGLRELLDRSDAAHLSASASVRCSRVYVDLRLTDRRPHASAHTRAHTRMHACVFAAADVVCVLFVLDVHKRE
jgi:SpoVK/Ycf46/Vps4 family AAA+-type ATPase